MWILDFLAGDSDIFPAMLSINFLFGTVGLIGKKSQKLGTQ
jgi:hypothetical protein